MKKAASLLPLALALVAAALAALSVPGGRPTSASTALQAGPGTITVTSTPILGQAGKVLLVAAISEQGEPLARLCAFIDASPFTLAPTVMTDLPTNGDPCADSTPETVFPQGNYTLSAGIFVPGMQTPEKQIVVPVTVDGDQEVTLDGTALSAGALGLPIEGQLGACLPVTNVVWGHNNQAKQWLGFFPGQPAFLQDLTEFVPGDGYLVNVSADCTISSGLNTINLYAGWNLFGWR